MITKLKEMFNVNLYRVMSIIMHKYHLHHTRIIGPLSPDNTYLERCEWCGLSMVHHTKPILK